MAIKVGDRVPNGTFMVMSADGPKPKTTDELFKGKKVVLFAVPGAFTPTCHKNHLPGFVKNAAAIKSQGRRHHRRDRRQRRVRHGRLEEGLRRRERSNFWPTAAPTGPRPWAWPWTYRARPRHALAALRHGGRRRRGKDAQRRGGPRQGRRFWRGKSIEVHLTRHSGARANARVPESKIAIAIDFCKQWR